jgi:hypothetical protein
MEPADSIYRRFIRGMHTMCPHTWYACMYMAYTHRRKEYFRTSIFVVPSGSWFQERPKGLRGGGKLA